MLTRSILSAAMVAACLTVAAPAAGDSRGAALFTQHCAVCHQAGAQGIAGMYPPLADSVGGFVRSGAGRAYLVHVLSFGLSGAITVRGGRYNGFMQSWPQLSDDDIARLLNHVLTNFNAAVLPHDFTRYTAAEVKRDRARAMTSSDVYRELQTLGAASVKADAK